MPSTSQMSRAVAITALSCWDSLIIWSAPLPAMWASSSLWQKALFRIQPLVFPAISSCAVSPLYLHSDIACPVMYLHCVRASTSSNIKFFKTSEAGCNALSFLQQVIGIFLIWEWTIQELTQRLLGLAQPIYVGVGNHRFTRHKALRSRLFGCSSSSYHLFDAYAASGSCCNCLSHGPPSLGTTGCRQFH